jgi:hypothetical protein
VTRTLETRTKQLHIATELDLWPRGALARRLGAWLARHHGTFTSR